MPRTQRRRHASVIQQLLDAPQRFECFQALRLLLAWLAEHGIDEHTALAKLIRFNNSVSLRFPASQASSRRRAWKHSKRCGASSNCWITLAWRRRCVLGIV